jgi:hypothetical protein
VEVVVGVGVLEGVGDEVEVGVGIVVGAGEQRSRGA